MTSSIFSASVLRFRSSIFVCHSELCLYARGFCFALKPWLRRGVPGCAGPSQTPLPRRLALVERYSFSASYCDDLAPLSRDALGRNGNCRRLVTIFNYHLLLGILIIPPMNWFFITFIKIILFKYFIYKQINLI